MRRLLIVGGLVVIVLVGGSLWWRNARKTREPDWETVRVERGIIEETVVASGRLEADVKVDVYPRASALVERVLVDVGDFVKKGQVLAELDLDQLRARLERADALLAQAKAELARVQRGANPLQLVEAEQALQQAELEFREAERIFERTKALHEKGYASDEELEQARYRYEQARNRRESAQKRLQVLQSLPLPEEVARAEAALRQAEAARQEAWEEFQNARILAPISGVVLQKNIEEGTLVVSITNAFGGAARPVFTIGQVDVIRFVGEIDEGDVGRVAVGQEVRISVDAYPDEEFRGQLAHIGPQGVERGGAVFFPVRVLLPNAEHKLKPGMSATAEIIVEVHRDVLRVPASAVEYEEGKTFVYRPPQKPDAEPERVPVEIGVETLDWIEIRSGLQEGDEILRKPPKKKMQIFEE